MLLKVEDIIKNVPIIKVNLNDNILYILLEKFNLCGSIKVKPAYWMVKSALKRGELNNKKVILEASSGNTGIALSFVGKIFGIRVIIVLPKATASCKKNLIKSYGAEIVEVEGNTEKAILKRDSIYKSDPDKYWVPNQFYNWDNFWSHYWLTAETILNNLGKDIDFFAAGLGTSGTLLGTGKKLKEENQNIKIIGINPTDRIEGLRNFKQTKLKIPFYEKYKYLIDELINVGFEEAIVGVKELLGYGYFCGISSGAIFFGVKKFLKDKKGLKGVMIAPDGGDMYLDVLSKFISLDDFSGCK